MDEKNRPQKLPSFNDHKSVVDLKLWSKAFSLLQASPCCGDGSTCVSLTVCQSLVMQVAAEALLRSITNNQTHRRNLRTRRHQSARTGGGGWWWWWWWWGGGGSAPVGARRRGAGIKGRAAVFDAGEAPGERGLPRAGPHLFRIKRAPRLNADVTDPAPLV